MDRPPVISSGFLKLVMTNISLTLKKWFVTQDIATVVFRFLRIPRTQPVTSLVNGTEAAVLHFLLVLTGTGAESQEAAQAHSDHLVQSRG